MRFAGALVVSVGAVCMVSAAGESPSSRPDRRSRDREIATIPSAVQAAADRIARRTVREGAAVVGWGDRYHARFAGGAFSYIPAGSGKTQHAWTYRFREVRVADRVVVAADPANAMPTGAGTTVVEFARGMVTERYALGATGVEQVFLIHEPLGTGDVTIEGTISGAWRAKADRHAGEGAVMFDRPGDAPVEYGAVTIVDADHRATSAPVSLVADTLSIVVDGAWLAQARYPVAVDPVITQLMVVQGNEEMNTARPSIAYDSKRNRYAIVFERAQGLASRPRDVVGIFVSTGGRQIGSEFAVESNEEDTFDPDVAYNPALDQFFVAYSLDFSDSLTDTDVVGRRLDAATGATLSTVVIFEGLIADNTFDASVAADPRSGSGFPWMACWEDQDTSAGTPDWIISCGRVPPTGGVTTIQNASVVATRIEDRNPDVAFNVRTGKFVVVFDALDSVDTDIRGAIIDGATGATSAIAAVISDNLGDSDEASNPEISYSVWRDDFVVVWQREDIAIRQRPMTGAGVVTGVDVNSISVGNFVEPAVASGWGGTEAQMTSYIQSGSPTTNDDYDLLISHRPSASGALGAFNINEIGDGPTLDDRNSQIVFNPYYGWYASVWEHWTIPTVEQDIQAGRSTSAIYPIVTAEARFDADAMTDRAIVRISPTTNQMTWYVNQSAGGTSTTDWGTAGDVPVAGDYAGDNRSDYAVWRPANGVWYVKPSDGSATSSTAWGAGALGDVPVPADYDGDGRTDLAVFRPGSAAAWYIKGSAGGTSTIAWGTWGDVPVTGDFDDDGLADCAVWRPSTGVWWVRRSSGGTTAVAYGQIGDQPTPADYDGDGASDLAVYRPASGAWYVRQSTDLMTVATAWGIYGDLAVPGDFNGDGHADLVVWRAGTTSTFYAKYYGVAGSLTLAWGTSFDLPIAR